MGKASVFVRVGMPGHEYSETQFDGLLLGAALSDDAGSVFETGSLQELEKG